MTWVIANWKWVALGALIAFGALWLRERDQRIAERAAAEALVGQERARVAALEDSLRVSGPALDTARQRVDTAFIRYDSIRTQVIRVPYAVPGTTDTVTMALVDTLFVAAADSVRQACGILQLECARYRTFADSTMAAQGRIIEQLQIADRSKGGWTKALQWFGMGAAAGVALGVFVSR